MRCPRCYFDGHSTNGACPRCGYYPMSASGDLPGMEDRTSISSRPLTTGRPATLYSLPPMKTLKRGDVLRQGRYRLLEQLALPENQQSQGTAWLATDTQSPQSRVVIREVALLEELPANRSQEARSIALRLTELSQHPGFPKVIDVFSEQDTYYIVMRNMDGDSLATLLRRQGGAIPVSSDYPRAAECAVFRRGR